MQRGRAQPALALAAARRAGAPCGAVAAARLRQPPPPGSRPLQRAGGAAAPPPAGLCAAQPRGGQLRLLAGAAHGRRGTVCRASGSEQVRCGSGGRSCAEKRRRLSRRGAGW
jgi:hypothetical protein